MVRDFGSLLEATQSGKRGCRVGVNVDFLNQNYVVLLPGGLNKYQKRLSKDMIVDS